MISYFMWNKIVLVYFESYFDAGTCLDRILYQYLLCKSIIHINCSLPEGK